MEMFYVTGAQGFIGRAVVSRLAECGHPVTAVSRRPTPASGRISYRTVDSYGEVQREAENGVLIHLAESRDIETTLPGASPLDSPAVATLELLLQQGWQHVIYASSAVVYGDCKAYPRRPEEPVSPTLDYARIKLACERRVIAANGTVLRLANVYGPGMAPNTVISDILSQIPGTQPLTLRDTEPVRDFLWIDDAAAGVESLAVAQLGGIYNLGTGRGVSAGELATTALTLAAEADRPVQSLCPAQRISHITLDPSSTHEACGWVANTTTSDGLAQLMGLK